MFKTLVIDIETLPTSREDVINDLSLGVLDQFEKDIAAVRPPSNYGAEAAQKWWAEKGDQQREAIVDGRKKQIEDAIRKTALDGSYGEVCVIGLAINNAAPVSLFGEDEATLLSLLNGYLDNNFTQSDQSTVTVVGHNVLSFDLRFLTQRYIINGIKPHAVIKRASTAKPWDNAVFDTMTQWAGVGQRISLDKLCKALSIKTPKGEITGATVYDFVKAGKIDEVAEYCLRDVEATRSAYNRMVFA